MVTLIWGEPGKRTYETGVDRGVLYPSGGIGVAWSGLVSVEESSSGGEVESHYFDGVKYLDIVMAEDFKGTIEAYSAPAEFSTSEGHKSLAPGLIVTQQPRTLFGFSYRTLIGNDLDSSAGYKIHLVYNATAAPSARTHKTQNSQPDPGLRSWSIETVPDASATTYRPTAHLIVNSTMTDPAKLAALEAAIYGSESANAALPTQASVIAILN